MRVWASIGLAATISFFAVPAFAQRIPSPSPAVEQGRDTLAGPQVDTLAPARRDSARPPKDSIGLRTPPPDSLTVRTPPMDTVGTRPAGPDSISMIYPPKADSLGTRPALPDSISRPTPPPDSAMKPIRTPGTVPR